MMRIEGHWETVDSLQDVIKIVREYYNEELADRADELLLDLIDGFRTRIEELTYYDDGWDDDVYND